MDEAHAAACVRVRVVCAGQWDLNSYRNSYMVALQNRAAARNVPLTVNMA